MNMKYLAYMFVMAGVTYLIRMLPLVVFRKEIKNNFIQSFLFYVPYAVLAAMTIPAIFSATSSVISAVFGLITAVLLAYKEKGLVTVAMAGVVVVLIVEQILTLF